MKNELHIINVHHVDEINNVFYGVYAKNAIDAYMQILLHMRYFDDVFDSFTKKQFQNIIIDINVFDMNYVNCEIAHFVMINHNENHFYGEKNECLSY